MLQFLRLFPVCLVVGAGCSWAASLSEMPSGAYSLDKDHAYVTFTYSHLGFSTPHVGFRSLDASLEYNAEDPAASFVSVTVDAASIDSRVDEFNEHLRGEQFFNVGEYPEISFTSTGIEMLDDGKAKITGNLTLMGVTAPVTLDAELTGAGKHPMRDISVIGVNAQTTLIRSQWNLGIYAPVVGDEVSLFISAEFHRPG